MIKIWKKMMNMKWELLSYFFVSQMLILFVLFVEWLYFAEALTLREQVISYVVIIVVVGMAVGYFAAQNAQRKVDTLHLAILQLSKGNLTNRIKADSNDSFGRIYHDFNSMAATLENKVKMLQKVSEEDVMKQGEVVESAVLEERRRLARDLHDTVSQQLFAIHMSASSMPKILERDIEVAKQVLEQLIQMSYHAQKQMRGLIAQLRPLELEGKSLTDALDKWFPDYCRQNGLQGSLEANVQGSISEAKEHQLFLIIQEAMANVVKHAAAKQVVLSMNEMEHQYVLSISDDGKGFNRSAEPTSYGLSTMRERAQKLGGDTEIFSKPGSGTRIKVTIPKFEEA